MTGVPAETGDSSAYAKRLLLLYAAWWAALAIAPYTYAEVPYDAWHSQKDSALMTVGVVIAIALVRRLSTQRGTGMLGGTGGVGNG